MDRETTTLGSTFSERPPVGTATGLLPKILAVLAQVLFVLLGTGSCSSKLPETNHFGCPCVEGWTCIEQACYQDCPLGTECAGAEVCDASLNVCMPPPDFGSDIGGRGDALGNTAQTYFGMGPGGSCADSLDCRIGLMCVDQECTSTRDLEEGALCTISNDCGQGLVCALDVEDLPAPRRCVPEGDGTQGDICSSAADCLKGYYCHHISFTGTCQPEGDGEVGVECDDSTGCLGGLHCTVDGRCGIVGNQVPLFAGQDCESSSEIGGVPRVLFEVPRGGQPLKDFYRLPFPNDIRVKKGHLDLSGHPTPGPGLVGFDIAARTISFMEADLGGYGTNPVVYFRFSERPDLGSINTGSEANIVLVDITDQLESGYGKKISVSWVASTGRGLYICQNYLAIYAPWARPLKDSHTYVAMVLNTVVTDSDDGGAAAFGQDSDFAAMLGDSAPTDPDLEAAWTEYALLRDFLSSTQAGELGITKSGLAGAALFTTDDPTAPMVSLAKDTPTAQIMEAVLCDGEHVSPCDDGLIGEEHIRGCMDPDPDFHEVQGIVKLPRFQAGEKPYLEIVDGGALEWDALNRPVVQGFEDVCFSATIPKGQAPEGGWPVLLYAHGTGGNYRSHISRGVADELADMTVWNSQTSAYDRSTAMAVLGWDQVLHGPRGGPVPLNPQALVFNYRNPGGLLGNFYQASAEVMSIVGLLSDAEAGLVSVGGVDTGIDPEQIHFMGHSQGGTIGPLATPYLDMVRSLVLSGTGGGMVEALLRRTSPVDVRNGVVLALQDENVGRTHPVVALLQHYVDSIDPINYAGLLFYTPVEGHKVATFQSIGLHDLDAPAKTTKALAQAMRAMLAKAPSLSEDEYEIVSGVQEVELPYSGSFGIAIEYGTPPEDGHMAIFENADGVRHYVNFLGTACLDAKPTLVE